MKKLKPNKGAAPASPLVPAHSAEWKLWHWIAIALGALLVVFEAYSPALSGPFLLDDLYLPFGLPGAEHFEVRRWLSLRPLLGATFLLNFRTSGTEPYSYHVVNVVLHWIASGLAFLVLRRSLHWVGVTGRRRDWFALFGGSIFLLHPVQTEAVAYIASRSDVLSTLFAYAALLVFVSCSEPALRLPAAIAVLFFTGCAVLSKEQGAILPAVFVLADLYWRREPLVQRLLRNWKLYVPLAVAGGFGVAFILRTLKFADTAGFGMKDLTWYQYFFTQCRAIWLYFRLLLVPFGQNVDHDFAISQTLMDRGAVFGLVGLLALVGLAWWQRNRFPLAFFGLLVFFIFLAPTSSFLPIRDPIAERRLYGPMLGFLMIVLDLIRRVRFNRQALAAFAAVPVVLACLTYARASLYGSDIAIWADSVSKAPSKMRPRFQLGYAYYKAQRCPEAVQEFEKTARLEKPDIRLLVDWAQALDCVGKPDDAVAKLNQAAMMERSAHVQSQIGMIRGKQGRMDDALAALDAAEKIDPGFAMTYVYRGNVYLVRGERAKAREQFQRALQLEPSNVFAIRALQAAQ